MRGIVYFEEVRKKCSFFKKIVIRYAFSDDIQISLFPDFVIRIL